MDVTAISKESAFYTFNNLGTNRIDITAYESAVGPGSQKSQLYPEVQDTASSSNYRNFIL